MTETDLKPLLAKLAEKGLDAKETEQFFSSILQGHAKPTQIAAFITALAVRGETADDLAAATRLMRKHATTIKPPKNAIDIVGTGGDKIGTWNISTATAIVTAATGTPVAKHGSYAVSSKSGAAEVFRELGVNLDTDIANVQKALDETGLCFLMAPRHHTAMKHVAPIRAELGFRSIFNIIGPLSNPANVKRMMIGVFSPKWLMPFAEALQAIGVTHAIIVHGSDGLDEVSTTGETKAVKLTNNKIETLTIHPSLIGLEVANISQLIGGNPSENATAIKDLLAGQKSAYRDIVILNVATALYGTGHTQQLEQGAQMAADAIESGKAANTLKQFIHITNNGNNQND